jgi:hypothetical protein
LLLPCQWDDNNQTYHYRYGSSGRWDLKLVDSRADKGGTTGAAGWPAPSLYLGAILRIVPRSPVSAFGKFDSEVDADRPPAAEISPEGGVAGEIAVAYMFDGTLELPDFASTVRVKGCAMSNGSLQFIESRLLDNTSSAGPNDGWGARFGGDGSWIKGTKYALYPDPTPSDPSRLRGRYSYEVRVPSSNAVVGDGEGFVAGDIASLQARATDPQATQSASKSDDRSPAASASVSGGGFMKVKIKGKIELSSCRLFCLDPLAHAPALRISSDGSTVTASGGDARGLALGSVGFSSGVHYWEVCVNAGEYGSIFIGVAEKPPVSSTGSVPAGKLSRWHSTPSWGFVNFRATMHAASETIYGTFFNPGDTVGVLLNCETGVLSFFLDSLKFGDHIVGDLGPAFTGLARASGGSTVLGGGVSGGGRGKRARPLYPCIGLRKSGDSVSLSSKFISVPGVTDEALLGDLAAVDGLLRERELALLSSVASLRPVVEPAATHTDVVAAATPPSQPQAAAPRGEVHAPSAAAAPCSLAVPASTSLLHAPLSTTPSVAALVAGVPNESADVRRLVREGWRDWLRWRSGRWMRYPSRAMGVFIELDTAPAACEAACVRAALIVAQMSESTQKAAVVKRGALAGSPQPGVQASPSPAAAAAAAAASKEDDDGSSGIDLALVASSPAAGGVEGAPKALPVSAPPSSAVECDTAGNPGSMEPPYPVRYFYAGDHVRIVRFNARDPSSKLATPETAVVLGVYQNLLWYRVESFKVEGPGEGGTHAWAFTPQELANVEVIIAALPTPSLDAAPSAAATLSEGQAPAAASDAPDVADAGAAGFAVKTESPKVDASVGAVAAAGARHVVGQKRVSGTGGAGCSAGEPAHADEPSGVSTGTCSLCEFAAWVDPSRWSVEADAAIIACLNAACASLNCDIANLPYSAVASDAAALPLPPVLRAVPRHHIRARAAVLRVLNAKIGRILPLVSIPSAELTAEVLADAAAAAAGGGGGGVPSFTSGGGAPLQLVGSMGRRLVALRTIILTSTKRTYWDAVLRSTTTRTPPPQDEYEEPKEIRKIRINRVKNTTLKLAALDSPDARLSRSVLGQLFTEIGAWPAPDFRRAYVGTGHGGQKRIFKVQFVGEGVDDAGGPYRATFEQVVDELQSDASSVDGHSCLLPLLMPCANRAQATGSTGRDKFVLVPDAAVNAAQRFHFLHFLGRLTGVCLRNGMQVGELHWRLA